MNTYTVSDSEVKHGITVTSEPYPHVTLGDGGNKRATWITLGKQDASKMVQDGQITKAGVIALKDKETNQPNGKFLLVSPRDDTDNRAMVLWSVRSGYRGNAGIEASEGVVVIGYDHAWHSGRGNMGENAEMLAILKPGQELRAEISGRHVQENRARLSWDGKEIKVEFGDDSLFTISEAEPEGDYL